MNYRQEVIFGGIDMIKKVLCLVLALSMLCGVVMLSSCGKTTTLETNERLPATISVLGITSKETTHAEIP